jgi:hypothetical protein
VALLVGIAIYIFYLLMSVLSNPLRNKPQTVLIRILTNYTQVIMIVKEFEMKWPKQVSDALNSLSILSSSQEIIISIDCFIIKSGLKNITENIPTLYIKVIVFGLLPIGLGLIASILWMVFYFLVKNNKEMQVRQNIMVTVFIITFIAYPTITSLTFSLFNCTEVDGNLYLKRDLSVECWTKSHF